MPLRKTPFEFVTAQPRRVLVGGVFATFAAVTIAFGLSSSLVLTPSPALACQDDCGDNNSGNDGAGEGYGHDHGNNYGGHHENGNDSNCGGCGNNDDDDDDDNDDHDDGSGMDNGGGNNGGGNVSNDSSDTYERMWREVNNYTRGNRRSSAHYNILKNDRRGRRVRYVRTRRVVRVEHPRRIVRVERAVRYVQPRRVQVIRPRIVRELRPSYRTALAIRAGRYERVVYTAPAMRYAAPVSRHRVVYSQGYEGYGSGTPRVTAYAAHGRVGVRARRVERSRRGRITIRSVSAYAQGRNARVSIGGSRIYGNVAPRSYASGSYVYADESGADIVYAGRRYRTTTYGMRGELVDGGR